MQVVSYFEPVTPCRESGRRHRGCDGLPSCATSSRRVGRRRGRFLARELERTELVLGALRSAEPWFGQPRWPGPAGAGTAGTSELGAAVELSNGLPAMVAPLAPGYAEAGRAEQPGRSAWSSERARVESMCLLRAWPSCVRPLARRMRRLCGSRKRAKSTTSPSHSSDTAWVRRRPWTCLRSVGIRATRCCCDGSKWNESASARGSCRTNRESLWNQLAWARPSQQACRWRITRSAG